MDDAVAATCRMTLTKLTILSDGYRVQVGDSFVLALVLRGNGMVLRFEGLARAGKKGLLVRKVLRKQFNPIVPPLRIRLRRVR